MLLVLDCLGDITIDENGENGDPIISPCDPVQICICGGDDKVIPGICVGI